MRLRRRNPIGSLGSASEAILKAHTQKLATIADFLPTSETSAEIRALRNDTRDEFKSIASTVDILECLNIDRTSIASNSTLADVLCDAANICDGDETHKCLTATTSDALRRFLFNGASRSTKSGKLEKSTTRVSRITGKLSRSTNGYRDPNRRSTMTNGSVRSQMNSTPSGRSTVRNEFSRPSGTTTQGNEPVDIERSSVSGSEVKRSTVEYRTPMGVDLPDVNKSIGNSNRSNEIATRKMSTPTTLKVGLKAHDRVSQRFKQVPEDGCFNLSALKSGLNLTQLKIGDICDIRGSTLDLKKIQHLSISDIGGISNLKAIIDDPSSLQKLIMKKLPELNAKFGDILTTNFSDPKVVRMIFRLVRNSIFEIVQKLLKSEDCFNISTIPNFDMSLMVRDAACQYANLCDAQRIEDCLGINDSELAQIENLTIADVVEILPDDVRQIIANPKILKEIKKNFTMKILPAVNSTKLESILECFNVSSRNFEKIDLNLSSLNAACKYGNVCNIAKLEQCLGGSVEELGELKNLSILELAKKLPNNQHRIINDANDLKNLLLSKLENFTKQPQNFTEIVENRIVNNSVGENLESDDKLIDKIVELSKNDSQVGDVKSIAQNLGISGKNISKDLIDKGVGLAKNFGANLKDIFG
ncbi:unnamed protein product [Caenorhabditis bovis]|uniref:Uncharacterized protein n=1 Tax=Caenorhabditis bovis TaxID=2654633 RepID=A0A8S1ET85_9PELO|nr:unnamed protein product [Caenorhabditis bovis]